MKLSSKKHGRINVFYYKNPAVFHTYALSGRTITERLLWMFVHIPKRSDLTKSDLKLIADSDGNVRMVNRITGGGCTSGKLASRSLGSKKQYPISKRCTRITITTSELLVAGDLWSFPNLSPAWTTRFGGSPL
jgi:hypothetical protein